MILNIVLDLDHDHYSLGLFRGWFSQSAACLASYFLRLAIKS